MLQCQGCHLAGASGTESAGVPQLAGYFGHFVGVEGGRAYLVQVPGVSQAPLSNAALAALLNWMLQEFSPDELPEPFVGFTEAEVAEYRNREAIDVAAVRAELVALIQAREAKGAAEPR